MALIAAEKAVAVMETATGSCPVSAVYVWSVSWFGHFAALSLICYQIPPLKYSQESIAVSLFPTLRLFIFSP